MAIIALVLDKVVLFESSTFPQTFDASGIVF